MNSPQQPSAAPSTPPPGMGVDDVLYTLFRHKWLILAFFCLGVVAACYVRVTKPPNFASHAKIKIHWLDEVAPPPGTDPDRITTLRPAIAAALNAEKETIKTLDVASNVAVAIGPRRLLLGKGDDVMQAAGLVCGSIDVDILPAAPVMTVSFRHKDKSLVQAAVNAVIKAYLQKRNEGSTMDEQYVLQEHDIAEKLAETQRALSTVLLTNKLVSIEDTKKAYQEQQTHWKDVLRTAEVELAAKKAALSDGSQQALEPGSTNSALVPADIAEEYSGIVQDLAHMKSQERELVTINRYTELHPAVLTVRGEIKKLTEKKIDLLSRYPGLVDMSTHGTNSPVVALAADLGAIRALTGKIAVIQAVLVEIEKALSQVLTIEPVIADLTQRRNQYATNLASFSKAINEARFAALSASRAANISTIETPTPPEQDRKKLMKMLMMAFLGCVGAGLGLAFAIDFFLDRSIKRSADIERHLKLPVFLSIPDTGWTNQIYLPWSNGNSTKKLAAGSNGNGGGNGNDHALAHWDPVHHLQPYTDGLRERLLTYFEINDQAQKRPKLVGLTACAQGAGVTTLASGLAASLSRVGNGNVLLVDMNVNEGVARSFHHGKPGCGLTETPGPDTAAGGLEQEKHNLYLATLKRPESDEAVPLPVQSFNQLMPKLNASEYDYIIFDLPPVSQTSATPRYSGYMDLVLLVLESEKTGQQRAAKASTLMQESRAKVAAVLNKYRQHVPAALAQDC